MKEALYWQPKNGKVECLLCPHHCSISEGKRGICGVRENRAGKLCSLVYGLTTGAAVDPVEKKPLFHFYPGSDVLSFGTVGCNLKCLHCQNYTTSQARPEDGHLQPIWVEDVLKLARKYNCGGVAWTYNEPTVWYEFTLEGSKLAKKNGLYTVYVTNGYIEEAPLKELAPYLDAMNIDVKAFTEEFYRKVSKARLRPVLDTCMRAKELGIHIELTYLIIPTRNDSRDEMRNFCGWVAERLGVDVPVHFSRFHPDYKLTNLPSTSMETLDSAFKLAKEAGLNYIYLGNIWHADTENTYCPKCSTLLIERHGFSVSLNRARDKKCPKCGNTISIVG